MIYHLNFKIQVRILCRIIVNIAATQALATMAGGAGSALTGAISTNIFLSVILGMSMKKLWLMITTLQIMTNLPLL